MSRAAASLLVVVLSPLWGTAAVVGFIAGFVFRFVLAGWDDAEALAVWLARETRAVGRRDG